MRCKYEVVMVNGDEYNCDDCLVGNFKLFFNCCKKEIRNCIVWLDNGDGWIYFYGRYKWRWEKFKSGVKKGQLRLF